ncbi:MAG: Fur family transcriptional regulator [Thermoleophilaceae bacterium]
MSGSVTDTWSGHTRRALMEAGHRTSAPRDEVIEAIDRLGCSITARAIADHLRARESNVGLASIYRALELLDRLGLVQRFDVGDGGARYEPALPSGEHHHHMVCDSCGKVEPFEDDALERAITHLSGKTDFAVAAHDITLHGECPDCRASA